MPAHRRIVLLVIALSAMATAIVVAVGNRPSQDGSSIRGSGVIEATETTLSSKVGGRVIELHCEEGASVRRGDLVARIDTADLDEQRRQAVAALGIAEAKLASAVNGSRPEQIAQARALLAQAQAAVTGARAAEANASLAYRKATELRAAVDAAEARRRTAEAVLRQAEENLRLARAGSRRDQVAQANSAVDQAMSALRKAEVDADRIEDLVRQGAVSPQQWDAARTARDTAKAQLEQARARLRDLEAGARPEELGAAEAVVSQARASLEGAALALRSAQETYADRIAARSQRDAARAGLKSGLAGEKAARAQLDLLLVGARTEDIAAARHQVEQARAQVAFVDAQIRNARVYAPTDGVVTSRIAEMGEVVASGGPIAIIADLDSAWLRVYVPENRYGVLRIGQEAQVLADSFPGVPFRAHVSEIASEAEFTPKNVQTEQERVKLVFGVKLQLVNAERRLKPGMPADAIIRLR